MANDDYPPSARMTPHPLHALLSAFPVVCFTGTLLTDLAYVGTYDIQWSNFSIWLLTAGLIMGALSAIVGLFDLRGRRVHGQSGVLPHALGGIVALVLALFNAFVHSRDGYTSVMPAGLTLSILTVAVLMVSIWFGEMPTRRRTVAN